MKFIVLRDNYSILKFTNGEVLPDWIYTSEFYSITKTVDEISVVTTQTHLDPDTNISSKDWRIFKIIGPLDLSSIGIISEISAILKNADISIFTISTFETDYILVKQADLQRGVSALNEYGHFVMYE